MQAPQMRRRSIGPMVQRSIALAASMLCAAAASGAEPAGGLPSDWKHSVTIPQVARGDIVFLGESKVLLAVDNGWLTVRRETADGELEWEIVLAEASDAKEPQVKVAPLWGGLDLRYRDYFIREAMGKLRVFRELKSGEASTWRPLALEGELKPQGSAGQLRALRLDDWVWAQSGPAKDRADVLIRVQHAGLNKEGSGFMGGPGNLVEMWYGKARVAEEGDLLIANRTTFEAADRELREKKFREGLGKQPAPELVAKEWLSGDKPLTIESLKGKVVLLDFWATWCTPCVKKLPEVEALHKKFAKRGLVVIGVHSANKGETAAAYVKEHGFTFPMLVDTGETANRYSVEGLPDYFLIDKTGKPVWGFSHVPPEEYQIEQLLK